MITKKPGHINLQALYIIIMLLQFILLRSMIFPVINPMVFLLYLLTAFSMVIRWRFNVKPVYMLIDLSIILIISLFYPPAYLCLVIFAYYFAYKDKLLYLVPLIIIGIFLKDTTYYLLLLQAFLFGIVLLQWSKDNAVNKELLDHQRRRTYELELVQSHLLSDYQDTERMSRLSERQRIAEILHDNLGHELTAAHLSLKAYRTLLEMNKLDLAQKTLDKVEDKLTYSLEQLKASVSYIEPSFETGFHDLTHIIDNYIYPIHFTHSGNVLNLKPYIWQLILMSMKEAFTNITKHATPKKITVHFEVTDFIVRILIENDGFKPNNSSISGNGLRYMRSRLEAINGSLSIQKRDIFQLIIIIPLESGR